MPSEHLFEFRFKPNARVLDHRGEWAEALSEALMLPKWSVQPTRALVHDENDLQRAFFGHRNAGFCARNCPTFNFFPDHAARFVRSLFALSGFGTVVPVNRIGVRSRFAMSSELGFPEVRSRFLERFCSMAGVTCGRLNVEGASTIVDVGVTLKLVDAVASWNLVVGPMVRAEFPAYFEGRDDDEFPEAGLFVDVDCFSAKDQVLDEKGLIREMRTLAERGWSRAAQVREIVLGE